MEFYYNYPLVVIAILVFVLAISGYIIIKFFKIKYNEEIHALTMMGIILGLVSVTFGVINAAQTIHLYVNGIETSATIEKIYWSKSPSHSNSRINRKHRSKPSKHASVSYEHENSVFISDVKIRGTAKLFKGNKVQVIYLPTESRKTAIRGHALLEIIILLPVVFILIGAVIFGMCTGGLSKEINNVTIKEKLHSIGGNSMVCGIIGMLVILPILLLYIYIPIYVPAIYNKIIKKPPAKMIYKPLMGPGVVAKEISTADMRTICLPMKLININREAASPGDIIELSGQWGELTENKIPRIRPLNGRATRLKILQWTDEVITAEIPESVDNGMHRIYVNCLTRPPPDRAWVRTVRKEILIQ